MLEPGDQDLIARSEARPCIGLRDEVDALGRAADEDDLPCGVGVDEPTHPLACSLYSSVAAWLSAWTPRWTFAWQCVSYRSTARRTGNGRCEEAALSRYTRGWPFTVR